MGSNQALSNGNEPEEVTDLLQAFQRENQVEITITLTLGTRHGVPAMLATAVASNRHADPVVRARWASCQAVLWGKEHKSLVGLLTGLLYRLDFEVGEEEMRSIGVKRA